MTGMRGMKNDADAAPQGANGPTVEQQRHQRDADTLVERLEDDLTTRRGHQPRAAIQGPVDWKVR